MSMITNLHGRLRNTPLPVSKGLLPLFEGVINSIHAIDEADSFSEKGEILVRIVRDPQQSLQLGDEEKRRGAEPTIPIVGFDVIDNGIGFDERNMESFETLDTQHKEHIGGRGVGRLLWLKAYEKVSVTSHFRDDDGSMKRQTFMFDAKSGVSKKDLQGVPPETVRTTSVNLIGFDDRYRKAAYKTAPSIAGAIFEHCLWYFVRDGGAPSIVIEDGDDRIELDRVYDQHMISSAKTETITIKDINFELTHIKLRANSSNNHVIAFCAANRLVKEEPLSGKIRGLFGKLTDENGEFVYSCYVTSSFLDLTVRPERTDFDIMENAGDLFAETEISLSDIRNAVIASASDHLGEYLSENQARAKDRVEEFVSRRAPRYRPILSRIPEEAIVIDPSISDKDLDLTLHKHLARIEEELLATGHDVLNPDSEEDMDEYEARLREYLKTAEDIKMSDLANYVSHRRVILELLERAIQKGSDGKYAREDLIHGLIMPMRRDSNEVMPDSCNLWLLDERLAFHDFLASDKTLASMPITGSSETKEPDIIGLNVFDNPVLVSEGEKLPLASIVVVEIKRPMRDDASEGEEKDPIEQALGYLDRVRQGKVTTSSGRPIPESESIPGFCYVICDLTPSIRKRCRMHDAKPTSDGLGFFLYQQTYNAYVEIISFDRLVNAAKERNRAFFDKLGLPTD